MAKLNGNFVISNFENACIKTSSRALPTSLLAHVTRILKENREYENKTMNN